MEALVSRRGIINPATEAEFFAYRHSLPNFQDHVGIDNPLITTISAEELSYVLSCEDVSVLSQACGILFENPRMEHATNLLLHEDAEQIWQDLSDTECERIHKSFFSDDWIPDAICEDDGRLMYAPSYLPHLMFEGTFAFPEKVAQLVRKNAAALFNLYESVTAEDMVGANAIVQEGYRRFVAALHEGKIGHVDPEWALERIERLQFRIQDSYTFRKEWAKHDDNDYEDAGLVAAYYGPDEHAVVFPASSRERHAIRQKYVIHELFHAVEASSYMEKDGKVSSKRTGLSSNSIRKGETSPRTTHAVFSERCTEVRALINTGFSPDSAEASYFKYLALSTHLIGLAGEINPDIDFNDLLLAAAYEQPQTIGHSPDRWPARKALGKAAAEIFRPGFLNQLDCFIAAHGFALARACLRSDWQAIYFDKAFNHRRHKIYKYI